MKSRQYAFWAISGLGGTIGGLVGALLYYFFVEIMNSNISTYDSSEVDKSL